MAAKLFKCPACHEAHQFASIDLAEMPRPIGYVCQGCGVTLNVLPAEIEQGQRIERRRPRIFG